MSPSTGQDDDDRVFRALADPTRRAVLDLLRDGPRTTGDLAEQFETTRFSVMKHLRVLVEANLVLVERRGRERLNFLNSVPIRRISRRWVRRFEANAADRLLDLGRHVERAARSGKTIQKNESHRHKRPRT